MSVGFFRIGIAAALVASTVLSSAAMAQGNGLALGRGIGKGLPDEPFDASACEVNPFTFGLGEPLLFEEQYSVDLNLPPIERELLSLAIPGYVAALEAEIDGTDGQDGSGNFPPRFGGLVWFATVTVPCIQDKIHLGGTLGDQDDVDVTFNEFERVAVQIMTSIWNADNGVMSHHLAGCAVSAELNRAPDFSDPNLCATFWPLGGAATRLFDKVSTDQ